MNSKSDGSSNELQSPTERMEQLQVETNPMDLDFNIEDFPPEILLKILGNLDTPSLFACRLVSRKWLEISSPILHKRPESEIHFSFENGEMEHSSKTGKKILLSDFTETFKESKNCPYARFSVFNKSSAPPHAFFEHKDWIEFVSVFGDSSSKSCTSSRRITCLCLDLVYIEHTNFVLILAEKLKDLLLHKIPYLEEFGLRLWPDEEESQEIRLFSNPNTKPSAEIQLPHLRVLHLASDMCENCPRVVEELLRAAVNLQRIEPFIYDTNFFTTNFQFLYSLGKIHLIREADIELDEKFMAAVRPIQIETAKTHSKRLPLVLNLKDLKVSKTSTFPNDSVPEPIDWANAANFLSLVFEASKNTLRKLSLHPLGFLSELELPKFPNLTELTLIRAIIPPKIFSTFTGLRTRHRRYGGESYTTIELPTQMFHRGVRARDVFPAVRILNFGDAVGFSDWIGNWDRDWGGAFPQEDSIPQLPLVEKIKVIDTGLTENAIATLALMCPNLKSFTIKKEQKGYVQQQMNFQQVGRGIWTHMTQLEYLEVDVQIDTPDDNWINLDSCFTGISKKRCQRLKKQNNGLLRKVESEVTVKRSYPSLLDMKNLKKMTLTPFSKDHFEGKTTFLNNMSWISEEYAFKFMPHLRPVDPD